MKELWTAVKKFPQYIAGYVLGLIVAILSDLTITTLAVTGVVGGVALESAIWGVVIFFGLYSFSRVASFISNSIGYGLRDVGIGYVRAGERIAGVFENQQPLGSQQDEPPFP